MHKHFTGWKNISITAAQQKNANKRRSGLLVCREQVKDNWHSCWQVGFPFWFTFLRWQCIWMQGVKSSLWNWLGFGATCEAREAREKKTRRVSRALRQKIPKGALQKRLCCILRQESEWARNHIIPPKQLVSAPSLFVQRVQWKQSSRGPGSERQINRRPTSHFFNWMNSLFF